mmetsp:Transcript_16545/g.31230  ORF Transcript_16545/g.31230 Transcript_16545/m.31230 type:complete len:203 (+) Transcript_16545:417-1025(+)
MTPAKKYPAHRRCRLTRSCRRSSEIRSPGMAISPRPSILNCPGNSPSRAGILSTIGTLCPVPPPVATSIMTDFLKITGEMKTQKMSKKNVQIRRSVPTFKFGNRTVRCKVSRNMTAMMSCKAQPMLSSFRKMRKQTARTKPTSSDKTSVQVCSFSTPSTLTTVSGSVHAFLALRAGKQDAKAGSNRTHVVDTAPEANRKSRR